MLHLRFLGFEALFIVQNFVMKPMFRKLDQFPSSLDKEDVRLFGWVQQK
jgi:hypothetical protein